MSAARAPSSANSLIEATRNRARYSGHGNAIGAAGYISDTDDDSYSFLGSTGETSIFDVREGGFPRISIGAAWDNEQVRRAGFFGRLLKKARKAGIDLDLGCLYELENGSRGCIQAFGENFGAYEKEPYVRLGGDERTGDTPGDDELIAINGSKWPEIRQLLIYMYIYDGAENWAEVKPQIHIRMPGEKPVIVTLHTHRPELALCAIAGMENVRGGIRITNHTEYFPGHAEMDRAFGFGIDWEDGVKTPQR